MRSARRPESAIAPDSLGSSEARFRALVQYSADVITVLAPDGAVLYNPFCVWLPLRAALIARRAPDDP